VKKVKLTSLTHWKTGGLLVECDKQADIYLAHLATKKASKSFKLKEIPMFR